MHKLQEGFNKGLDGFNGEGFIVTKNLQIESLVRAMDAYGYHTSMDSSNGSEFPEDWDKIYQFYKFRNDEFSYHNPNFLSFGNAVKLHNGCRHRVVGNLADILDIRSRGMGGGSLKFHTDTVIKGRESRLVNRVKLQKRSGGDIIVQNHFVTIANVG